MTKVGNNEIHTWQWPNILSLDAALIAVLWQFLFSHALGIAWSLSTATVLALSVWLTYQADRLFDVSKRSIDQLLSRRHQFALKHRKPLWRIWWPVLAINVTVAFFNLSPQQLFKGALLLAICLSYTLLNQKLSKRFFPKQLCVAIIYTGGIVIFLPIDQVWLQSTSLICLCLLNCRLISSKEVEIDRALGEHSQVISNQAPNFALFCATASVCSIAPNIVTVSILANATLYLGLALNQQRFSVEAYRVLIDGALLIAPTCILTAELLNGA